MPEVYISSLAGQTGNLLFVGMWFTVSSWILIVFLVFIRWPSLLPILNPDYVAKKIIHAVLTDQVYLLLPKSIYLIAALKKLVSTFSVLFHISALTLLTSFYIQNSLSLSSLYLLSQ